VSPAPTGGGGDRPRFTRLVETAGPRVLAYLARRVDPPGDAADLLAEVFATAWRRVGDLPAGDGEAAAWLFGIARGTLANHRRGQTRRLDGGGPPADETVALRAARQRLLRARRRLRAELDAAGAGPDGPGRASFTPTDTWPRATAER
jgi:Sigma-70 region 2